MNNCPKCYGLLFGISLLGCDSRIDAVNQQMAEIRNQPHYQLSLHQSLRLCHYLTIG